MEIIAIVMMMVAVLAALSVGLFERHLACQTHGELVLREEKLTADATQLELDARAGAFCAALALCEWYQGVLAEEKRQNQVLADWIASQDWESISCEIAANDNGKLAA